jgi:hypothetical protein
VSSHVLNFRTDVEGLELEGVDILHLDEEGLIKEITACCVPSPASRPS